jgi:hypothetical protein
LNPLASFQLLEKYYLQLVDLRTSESSEHLLGESVVNGLTLASLVVFPSLDGSEGS